MCEAFEAETEDELKGKGEREDRKSFGRLHEHGRRGAVDQRKGSQKQIIPKKENKRRKVSQ